jgi:hypothetical protein
LRKGIENWQWTLEWQDYAAGGEEDAGEGLSGGGLEYDPSKVKLFGALQK